MMARTAELAAGLDDLPLPALLSMALVVFTIECDSELEVAVAERGETGPLSLVVWLNTMQYLRSGPTTVAHLCGATHLSFGQIGFVIGKLEFWGFVALAPPGGSGAASASASAGRAVRRQNVSAVKPGSVVEVTRRGQVLVETWPPILEVVEARWRKRHGRTLTAAVKAASGLAGRAGVQMPEGMPIASANKFGAREWQRYPAGDVAEPQGGHLPVVLGRALQAATMAYEQRSPLPMAVAANTLRVIDSGGTPPAGIHARSGTAPQTAASQLTVLTKYMRLAELVSDRSGRGKVVVLNAAGTQAQAVHATAIAEASAAVDPDGRAADALRALLSAPHGDGLAVSAALTPPAGSSRSSSAGVGRRKPAPIAVQTERFRTDPFQTLPHFPVWEQTRGFGP